MVIPTISWLITRQGLIIGLAHTTKLKKVQVVFIKRKSRKGSGCQRYWRLLRERHPHLKISLRLHLHLNGFLILCQVRKFFCFFYPQKTGTMSDIRFRKSEIRNRLISEIRCPKSGKGK